MCVSIQEARKELIRRERISTIGQLSTSIVHDLRNPLAAIYGGSELLMDGEWNESQVKRLAANIYRSSRAMKDMLQELVDVSRGRIQPAENCRLREVICVATEANAATAEAQGVSIVVSAAADIELPLERARMERVFQNLIANALEAMPTGGKIEIKAESSDSSVLVSFSDTGPGIPSDIRACLFQPFATSGKNNGLGLGLALSQQTVIDHGGSMWIDDSVGQGARFWIRLPRFE
jgi:signal transduction histidine kinase